MIDDNKRQEIRIGVLGGGSWATALVSLLCNHCRTVNWWMRNPEAIRHIQQTGHHPHYIQSIQFDPAQLNMSDRLQETIDQSDYLIIAIPSAFLYQTFQEYQPQHLSDKIVFSAIKGMINEFDTIPARYLHEQWHIPYKNIGIICGPCHAEEVAMRKLSYLTIACHDREKAHFLGDLLSCHYIRTTTTEDVFGAELAAVLKNVYAVAAGICHGLGYGDNFQAVLISAAIREMERFLDAAHEVHRDVKSAAYLGDLLVTAYSPYSRNRTFGTMVGKGYSVKWATIEMNMVAEGYYATKGIYEMNKNLGVKMFIADAVYRILYDKISPTVEMLILSESLH